MKSFINKIIIVLIFTFSISTSLGAAVTYIDRQEFEDGGSTVINGVVFNNDGSKMFISFQATTGNANFGYINEYNLSTPYDISTHTYAGDDERCDLDVEAGAAGVDPKTIGDLAISTDGLKVFFVRRSTNGANPDMDRLYRYDLTTPYDISTCFYVEDINPDTDALALGSTAVGDRGDVTRNHVQGVEINPDGTKIFLTFNDASGTKDGLKEYTLSTPFDITTMSLVKNAGISLETAANDNPDAIFFGLNGKRVFVTDHFRLTVTQFTLTNPYDTSSFTNDGNININTLTPGVNNQTRAIAFSKNGLKLFVSDDTGNEEIFEFDLVCPFTIIAGKCPPITAGDRTAMAEAQIEIAKKTIEFSTNTALNRLKWIRRNKDLKDLTNQNIKFNFSNQMLASISEAIKVSTEKKIKKKDNDTFYWSEGSLGFGTIFETNSASKKKLITNGLTFGADKFDKNGGIKGLAFRLGKNEVNVGFSGGDLDTDTYNLTYYSTSPLKKNNRYLDTIIGVGVLKSDITNVLDGNRLHGDRNGKQIYGTLKLKNEIKKGEVTFIPAGQLDLGYTLLDSYSESGNTAMRFEDQSIQSKNVRLSVAAFDQLQRNKYNIRRHQKLEYKVDFDRSSNVKYSYISDTSNTEFDTKLTTGALHNFIAETGFDLIFDDNLSLFLIYEQIYELGVGYSNKLNLALGYLPNKETKYTFSLKESEDLVSNFEIKKNINDYNISFNLAENLMNLGEATDASIYINKVF